MFDQWIYVCECLTWNHVLTCASVIFNPLAKAALSADARYFCLWNRFSNSATWMRVNEVRGFFRFGGVRFWYGCPMRRAIGKAVCGEMEEEKHLGV